MHKVHLMGGPMDGLIQAFASPPSRRLVFAVDRGRTAEQFISATYCTQPVPQTGLKLMDEHHVGLFIQEDIRDEGITHEAGILCANCGCDPATGKEV